jgi:hypothetical protein
MKLYVVLLPSANIHTQRWRARGSRSRKRVYPSSKKGLFATVVYFYSSWKQLTKLLNMDFRTGIKRSIFSSLLLHSMILTFDMQSRPKAAQLWLKWKRFSKELVIYLIWVANREFFFYSRLVYQRQTTITSTRFPKAQTNGVGSKIMIADQSVWGSIPK